MVIPTETGSACAFGARRVAKRKMVVAKAKRPEGKVF